MCIFHFRIVHKSTKFMLLYAAIHCEQCEVWRSDIWVQYVPDDNCHRALRIYICLHVNRSLNINCCANQTHTVYLINCPNIYLYKKKMYSYFVYAIKIQQYNKYEWYKILGLDYNLVEYFNFHRTISVSFDQLHSIYTPWSNTSLSTYDIQKKKKNTGTAELCAMVDSEWTKEFFSSCVFSVFSVRPRCMFCVQMFLPLWCAFGRHSTNHTNSFKPAPTKTP